VESELSAANFVRGASRNHARLAVAPRNIVDGLDGHVTHQQVDIDVREQGDLFFEQVRAVLDGVNFNAVAGLAALDRRGQVHAQAENILHGLNLRPGILESQQGGLGEEGVCACVAMIGGVFWRGLGDEQDGDFWWVNVYIRDEVTGLAGVEAGEVGALHLATDFQWSLSFSVSTKEKEIPPDNQFLLSNNRFDERNIYPFEIFI